MSKDWNRIEKDLLKELEEEEKNQKKSIDEVFREIYSKGTDEQKRAMIKSYSTSGGTVLSTNWDEVGKDKKK